MIQVDVPELVERPLSFIPDSRTRGWTPAGRRPMPRPAVPSPAALAGRIKLGGPVCVPVTDSYVDKDADLRAFLAQEALRFTYHLVHLSLSCAPEPQKPRLEWVEVQLMLTSSDHAEPAIAWSMTPLRITDPAEVTSSWQLGPQLKLLGVEATLGKLDRSRTNHQAEVYLEGRNELRYDPVWELRRTRTMALRGSHRMIMVVRAARGSTTTISGTVSGATVSGSILRREHTALPESITVSAVF